MRIASFVALCLTCGTGCGTTPRTLGGNNAQDGGVDAPFGDSNTVRCAGLDSDADGLCDDDEIRRGTNPNLADSDSDGLSDGDEILRLTNPLVADTDSDGLSDGEEVLLGSDPLVPDGACAMSETRATAVVRPVDIIFVIDNSSSMEAEIRAVQENININFAQRIAESGVDYRIIMLSAHGIASRWQVCISQPLSGHSCSPVPERPINTDRFFHYSFDIGSNTGLYSTLLTYDIADFWQTAPGGWSTWLREDAYKVFIYFTDDNENLTTSAQFDEELLSMSRAHFGTAEERNYVVHSIVGIAPRAISNEAYPPTDPIVSEVCQGTDLGVNEGRRYQELSILTGGLRFPLCRFGEYDVIFRRVASGVVSGAALPCRYALPTSGGDPVDPDRIILQYRSGLGANNNLTRVSDAAACINNGWYLSNGGEITLCSQTCEVLTADLTGQVRVLAGCDIVLD